ncbi:thioredoxin fold domain-containing protein [Flagellimonas algicola]|uniref:Thiol-disulfide isomerase n=1 Tax=Flagellimonas algicola TaxID=2583815 RepID=A0ABY2WQ08_9FLAO|nr:thioredoxin fold domain-containing protein [Allomuricauda algicola]TMU56756.1 thiol-disulfide isomerase [Allomuricauda algicola]
MATSRFFPFGLVALVFLLLAFTPNREEESEYRLILFEGSDWCVNCIRLEKNVLSNAAFITYAENHGISIERIDFPQRKELDEATQLYNAEMAEKYNFQGIFPTLILEKADTKETLTLEYLDQSCSDFIAQLSSNLKP